MKPNRVVIMTLVTMVCLMTVAGCGSKDGSSSSSTLNSATLETRPVSEIKAEVETMNEKQLKDAAGQYKKALAAKEAEVTKLFGKLNQVPVTEKLGPQAQNLTQDVESLGKSAAALTERLKIYVAKLKAMKVDTTGLEP
jgi:maltose-binding protein MalE